MKIVSLLCMNNTKSSFVRIVHPGGHVELHDRPILAGEIMLRNPRCCVAYPHVFKQPTAIVPAETTLMPGQKFYVVPVTTIKKLRRKMRQYSPSMSRDFVTSHQQHSSDNVNINSGTNSSFTILNMKSPKQPYNSLEQSNPKDGSCLSSLLKGSKRNNDLRKDAASSANNSPGGGSNIDTKSSDPSGWQPNLQSINEQ
ncbi:hypothetical protein LIER_27483 [Lithospermum erythrorhizon]|uniref:Uncharacterized protein n=1 Tax=Lithospermum erythrorhizon TaxID=34254 RepID=A0AAV3RFJ9_LITER